MHSLRTDEDDENVNAWDELHELLGTRLAYLPGGGIVDGVAEARAPLRVWRESVTLMKMPVRAP